MAFIVTEYLRGGGVKETPMGYIGGQCHQATAPYAAARIGAAFVQAATETHVGQQVASAQQQPQRAG